MSARQAYSSSHSETANTVSYDIRAFVNEQRGRPRDGILVAIRRELVRVDYKLWGKGRYRARAGGAEAYRAWLQRLGAVLRNESSASLLAPEERALIAVLLTDSPEPMAA